MMAMMSKIDTFPTLQVHYSGVSWQLEKQLQYEMINALTQEVQVAVGAHWGVPSHFRTNW